MKSTELTKIEMHNILTTSFNLMSNYSHSLCGSIFDGIRFEKYELDPDDSVSLRDNIVTDLDETRDQTTYWLNFSTKNQYTRLTAVLILMEYYEDVLK